MDAHAVTLPDGLAGSPLPTGLLGPDGDWLVRNDTLVALLGAAPAPFAALVDEPGLDAPRLVASDAPVRLRLALPDGASADAVVTTWSSPPRVRLVQLLDRTEVRHLETVSRRAVAALEAFVSRVSHDLRNPIGTSVGFAELLLAEESLDGEVRSFAQRIRSSSGRAVELLEAIVSEARTTDRVAPPDEVDVAELVAGIRTELAGLLADRDATVEVVGQLPRLRGDVRLLHRGLTTAIRSAVEHHPGAARVEVSAERADRAWTLVVDDDGPGLPTGEREGILGGDVGHAGAALALSLARAAIERRGGRLTLEDSERGGLRVRLFLPQRRAGDPDAGPGDR